LFLSNAGIPKFILFLIQVLHTCPNKNDEVQYSKVLLES
jgi:hypothetical protein